MTPGIALLALIIILGTVVILSPIVAESRYASQKLQHSDQSDQQTIAGAYRYVCWVTGTAMIAAAIVLLFRLEW
ncbi:hypothetical protein [Phormidesmis priestleyi]